MSWDFKHQKAVTEVTLKEIADGGDLAMGQNVILDLEFLPVDGADADACAKALKTFGYDVEVHEDGMIAASIGDVPLPLEGVWTAEERATKIALERGYEGAGRLGLYGALGPLCACVGYLTQPETARTAPASDWSKYP